MCVCIFLLCASPFLLVVSGRLPSPTHARAVLYPSSLVGSDEAGVNTLRTKPQKSNLKPVRSPTVFAWRNRTRASVLRSAASQTSDETVGGWGLSPQRRIVFPFFLPHHRVCCLFNKKKKPRNHRKSLEGLGRVKQEAKTAKQKQEQQQQQKQTATKESNHRCILIIRKRTHTNTNTPLSILSSPRHGPRFACRARLVAKCVLRWFRNHRFLLVESVTKACDRSWPCW